MRCAPRPSRIPIQTVTTKQMCHPDRSVAKWRDLLFFGYGTRRRPRAGKVLALGLDLGKERCVTSLLLSRRSPLCLCSERAPLPKLNSRASRFPMRPSRKRSRQTNLRRQTPTRGSTRQGRQRLPGGRLECPPKTASDSDPAQAGDSKPATAKDNPFPEDGLQTGGRQTGSRNF